MEGSIGTGWGFQGTATQHNAPRWGIMSTKYIKTQRATKLSQEEEGSVVGKSNVQKIIFSVLPFT